jgi:hypothetical protein
MNAEQITTSLKLAMAAKIPAFIWGSPGIGKSAVTNQLHKNIITLIASQLDAVDTRGIPSLSKGTTVWNTPSFFPTSGEGILFLDELNTAPPSVQAALYQLILDRRLGDYKLPGGWYVLAAGNRESDRAVTHRMSSALANRFLHLNMESDLDTWVKWALPNNIATPIIAFLRFRPELLNTFDNKSSDKAFATPRTWEFTSRLYDQGCIDYETISGLLGEGAAAELIGFLRIFKALPTVDSILANPNTTAVPVDPATMYALCSSLARRATDNTFDRIMEYAARIPADFQVKLVTDCISFDKTLVNTRSYIAWATKNSDILI